MSRVFPSYRTVQNAGKPFEIIPFDELVAKFKPTLSKKEIQQIVSRFRLKILSVSKYGEYTLRLSDRSKGEVLEIANRLYEEGYAEWAEPNFVMDIRLHDEDPLYVRQWHLNNLGQIVNSDSGVDINAPAAWYATTGSSDIIVAVVDDGVESHEDLPSSRLVAGFTAGGGNGAPGSGDKHGQAVAGIIAASHNELGGRGVAPEVKIMSIKVFVSGSFGTNQNVAWALDTARIRGADVINMSWGSSYSSQISDALDRADSLGRNGLGCILIASGGNDQVTEFPAEHEKVIAVGAVNLRDNPPGYTPGDYGVDIVAPSKGCEGQCSDGEGGLHECWGCLPDTGITTLDRSGSSGYTSGNYNNDFGGTSASAPQVAGVAALLLSFDDNLTADSVKSLLLNSANDYGNTAWDGHGRLNAYAALGAAGADVPCPTYPDCPDPEKKSVDQPTTTPKALRLNPVYPNPFNPSTTISFELDREREVTITVHDALGRTVETLASGIMPAGLHSVKWNPARFSSGIYYCRMKTEKFTAYQKLLFAK